MKAYGGVDIYTHVFLTSELFCGEWSASRPGRFTYGERAPSTHWIGGFVGPTAGLDNVEKLNYSAVGIATSYGLDDRRVRVRVPGG
jgi:hypothetical protein